MKILILSHERSLNKAETLLNAYKNEDVAVVCEIEPDERKSYVRLAKEVFISTTFNIAEIVDKFPMIDKIWTVSENLLPIQSQLESYYGIDNLTPFAAEVLSNKQLFDDFCRRLGLGDYIPFSITPTCTEQFEKFGSYELFTKPDIGTGSNVFLPNNEQNTPELEYRRWDNKNHLISHLRSTEILDTFFDINRKGIYTKRFNYKACRIMVQQYHWSTEPSICPVGSVIDGKVNIAFFVKNSKIKHGEQIDPNCDPIQSHSVSSIARERAVWVVSTDSIPQRLVNESRKFIQTIVDALRIRELVFAGPDFHISGDRLIAIDFNPRPGQFMNILDRMNNHTVTSSLLAGQPIGIRKSVLWGCAILKPGKIAALRNLETVSVYFNSQNTELTVGMEIPEFQNLQNKSFNVNLDITGKNEKELFDGYKTINQLLQDCITYE